MERHCKNCNQMLYAGHLHCSSCGAKWLEKRITMRQVTSDFGDMYLGLDTKFARTFIHLFTRPSDVINGYINGRRMFYVDAIRYMLLALLVSGIYTFLLRQTGFFEDYMMEVNRWTPAASDTQSQQEISDLQYKITNYFFDFQSFFYFLIIPFLALAARITFWGTNYYNFTEHVVFYLYTFAHITIASTPITILTMMVSTDLYSIWSVSMLPVMFLYNAYCYKVCFKLSLGRIVLKSAIAAFVLIATAITIVIMGILISIAVAAMTS